MKTLSWKAVRKGDIYCAPACGADCTHKAFLDVHAQADALIAKCKAEVGGKWKKHVHENLGWHFSISLIGGNITIRQSHGTYSISGFASGTPAQIYIPTHSTSIKKLIKSQLKEVQKEANRWNEYLQANMKALNLTKL